MAQKYYLLAGYINQVSIFSMRKTKMCEQHIPSQQDYVILTL